MQLQNLQQQPWTLQQPAVPRVAAARVPITIGVLLDGRIQELWVRDCLRQALAVPGVQLGTVVLVGASQPTLAERAHQAVDAVDRWLRCRHEPLFAPVDLVAALGGRAPLQVRAHCQHDGWQLDSVGAALLRAAQVDVWLCFTALPPRAPVPQLSRLGLWGLEIGPRLPAVNRWAGATEICARSPVTVAQLVDYTRAGGNALHRTCGATVTNSARRNRLLALRTGMEFFRRQLALLTQDEQGVHAPARMRPQLPLRYPDCTAPTLAGAASLSWQLLARVASNRWRALGWHDQWRIGYYFAEEGADVTQRPARLRSLVPPGDHDWADPFLVEHDGRRFIFFEELPYAVGRAHISAIEIDADGEPGAVRRVLARPYHLSYPFTFRWNDQLYMLPETSANGTVELYRCEQFPDRWSLHKVLLTGIRACDAALLHEQGRWWMFVNVAEPGADLCQQLHLYWSDTPLGPWQPHAANPVISDARRARGAGPLFRRDGVLYRPSQDCSFTYGYAVSINRVELLDPQRYEETPVGRLAPDWSQEMRCLHTFGALGRLRVIDYMVRRAKWSGEAGPAGDDT
jgi:hypothetical protein